MKNKELLRKEHESVRNKVGFFDFAHDILEVTIISDDIETDAILANRVFYDPEQLRIKA